MYTGGCNGEGGMKNTYFVIFLQFLLALNFEDEP